MAKTKSIFVCQSCGAVHSKWAGKCDACNEWNTIVEEIASQPAAHERPAIVDNSKPIPISTDADGPSVRMPCGMAECDRVLGGGIVEGSLTLVGGDPGIGKSTLMLQLSHYVAEHAGQVLYVSGEESFEQCRIRARRLGTLSDNLLMLTETAIDKVRQHIVDGDFSLVVVDSIQSMYTPELSAVPGSVGQVRECANEFLRLAKGNNVPIFLVGHVTKEGSIAGPRLLEHLVDTVLYFEGEGKQVLRILRAVKNRFGSTNEIGVFEMSEGGLLEVPDPSALFLNERPKGVSGSVVFPSIEGTRPLLVEVQALVGETSFATPRRTVTGVSPNRVALIVAVLEKRAGIQLADRDIYVNVVGGVRIEEPAADLAIATALVSSFREIPVAAGLAVFGEMGLAGEIRAVDMARRRIAESAKFGFTHALLPQSNAADIPDPGLTLLPTMGIGQAIESALEA
ncbi:MAG: DNA repair protein RadA [Candidatus Hydrogenedentota bacterium]